MTEVVTKPAAVERQQRRMLFVCGVHRSGTSIVHRCLRAHREISGFHATGVPEDEGQHLQSVFPPAWHYGGPGRFGFHSDSHLTERSSLATADHWDRLWEEWAPYWDLSRKVLIEKSPPNLLRMRFLQAGFAQSRFVAVLRHPIATAYATRAYKRRRWRPWQRLSIARLVDHWFHCHRIMLDDASSISHMKVMRFEDFSARPHEYLNEVCSFIGLEPLSEFPEVRAGMNEKYFDQWDSDLKSRRFRARMAPLLKRYEDAANDLGYSLVERA